MPELPPTAECFFIGFDLGELVQSMMQAIEDAARLPTEEQRIYALRSVRFILRLVKMQVFNAEPICRPPLNFGFLRDMFYRLEEAIDHDDSGRAIRTARMIASHLESRGKLTTEIE